MIPYYTKLRGTLTNMNLGHSRLIYFMLIKTVIFLALIYTHLEK